MEWIGWTLFIILFLCFIILLIVMKHRNHQILSIEKQYYKKIDALQQKLSRIEKELSHEKDIIDLIQEHMVEGILILDDADRIQLVNRTASQLLHIASSSWDCNSIFILTDNRKFLEALRKSKTENHTSVQQLLKIEGKYFRAYISRVEMGGIFGTIVLLVDVTYNVKAEKMRQEFTANVSHELKTPLTTIKGFGELFGSGMITREEDVIKYGSMIERESERLLFLINDIIRLSEIEEHTEMLDTPVNLEVCAHNAIQILEPHIQNSHIQVTLEGSGVLLHSNEGYMRELFINLIDNAIKYNNPNGKVTISIQRAQNMMKIVVSDNGIGIPLHAQSRIFERFYRVDKSRSKERGGTGLGLSIVKHIVDCHNGTISLKSELGKGTQITVLLPIR